MSTFSRVKDFRVILGAWAVSSQERSPKTVVKSRKRQFMTEVAKVSHSFIFLLILSNQK